MVDAILKRNQEMVALLSEVVMDMEDNDRVTPPVYTKIKQFFKEEDIPNHMKERIQKWEDIYGKID